MSKVDDYDGFKYFRRLIFEIELSALHKAMSEIRNNTELQKFTVYHERSSRYEFSIEGDVALDISLRGVSIGIIMSADDSVRSYREYLEKKFSLKGLELENYGPKVGEVHWAKAIRVAGNYIRHQREWSELAMARSKDVGLLRNGIISFSLGEFKTKILPLGKKDADENIKILDEIGLNSEEFLPGPSYKFSELCTILKLDGVSTALTMFEGYQKSLEAHLGLK